MNICHSAFVASPGQIACPSCGEPSNIRIECDVVLWCGECGYRIPTVVVTRHQGALDWLKNQQGIDVTGAVAHASVNTVKGKRIIGNVPPQLAAEAAIVATITLEMNANSRGQELTESQMSELGAHLEYYRVWMGGHR